MTGVSIPSSTIYTFLSIARNFQITKCHSLCEGENFQMEGRAKDGEVIRRGDAKGSNFASLVKCFALGSLLDSARARAFD
jgi:hypothetical protein